MMPHTGFALSVFLSYSFTSRFSPNLDAFLTQIAFLYLWLRALARDRGVILIYQVA